MSRQLKEDLEEIYESVLSGEKNSMKVGSGKGTTAETGDLDGPAKKTTKGSGPENTDAKKAEDAPENLQGDTVKDSKKKKGGTVSKFEELYKSVSSMVSEELGDGGSVEDNTFNDEIGDFPPAGADEESAERTEKEMPSETIKDLFNSLADIMAKIGDKLAHEDGEPEMIEGEQEMADGEGLEEEAVESTPAPEAIGKMTSKANMNVKGVKIVKKAVNNGSSSEKCYGTPKVAPETNLGPKTSLKANGSGAAVEGGNKSAFE